MRGTPASGKSTLLKLIYVYIKGYTGNRKAAIQIITEWPTLMSREKPQDIHSRLRQRVMGYPKPETITYILIDNSQATYSDGYLWEEFFKEQLPAQQQIPSHYLLQLGKRRDSASGV